MKIILYISILFLIGCSTPQSSTQSFVNQQVDTACGQISVFYEPPKANRYYKASIFHINNENTNRGKAIFKVPPGRHVVYLFNHDGSLDSNSFLNRFGNRGKGIEVFVEENTTYHLAAKFVSEKRFRRKNQENWMPVIWREQQQKCEI